MEQQRERPNTFVRLRPQVHREVKIAAAKSGMSMMDLVTAALEAYLGKREGQ
jgi:predicted HicB family RNase H-like nuclease